VTRKNEERGRKGEREDIEKAARMKEFSPWYFVEGEVKLNAGRS
jgi:hypothetical protein